MLLAASLMGDKMSALNWLGFAVCVCGISLHVGLKTYYSKSKCLFYCYTVEICIGNNINSQSNNHLEMTY